MDLFLINILLERKKNPVKIENFALIASNELIGLFWVLIVLVITLCNIQWKRILKHLLSFKMCDTSQSSRNVGGGNLLAEFNNIYENSLKKSIILETVVKLLSLMVQSIVKLFL